ncbi:hypothetical protein [Flavobacterium sp. 22076]|mgnify:CR=1 FL=1|uniref:hypothetical protein n=1 Tax=Flavobacterium sp. 22076 TaxID=3453866 RepID=UPI003F86D6EF
MRKHFLYFLLTMFITTSFLSCASFSKKKFSNVLQNLKREDISKLEGSYTLNPIVKYLNDKPEELDSENKVPDSLVRNNVYQFMVTPNSSFKKNIFKKSENNNRSIDLKFQNENLLSIKIHENSEIIIDTVLSGKYKKGMFYLDNKFLKCRHIPYLFGGCENNKRRIGLNKNGNLLVNEASDNSGALLLFFWAGSAYNVTYEYQRK